MQSNRDAKILKLASLDSISSLHAFDKIVEEQLHHCTYSTKLSLMLFVGLRLNQLEWFYNIEVSKFVFLVDDVYVFIEGQLLDFILFTKDQISHLHWQMYCLSCFLFFAVVMYC